MDDQVRRINAEYELNLSEEEIKLVAKQAEDAERLFKRLYEIDLTERLCDSHGRTSAR
jgi:Asp-tRNA(Asn)/Glu-tRNA(Gln) amidotransferase C subunit